MKRLQRSGSDPAGTDCAGTRLSDGSSRLVANKRLILSLFKKNWEFKKPVRSELGLQGLGALWGLCNSQSFSVVSVTKMATSLL